MSLFKPKSKTTPITDSSAKPAKATDIGIAYNMAKRSKMSKGGSVGRDKAELGADHVHDDVCMAAGGSCYAEGGKVDNWDVRDDAASAASSKEMSAPHVDSGLDAELDDQEDHLMSKTPAPVTESLESEYLSTEGDMVSKIMNRRKMMAEGGMVDLSENADEEYNHADADNFAALKKENYSESDGLDDLTSPMDSNEHGDMISKIRSKMRSKRGE